MYGIKHSKFVQCGVVTEIGFMNALKVSNVSKVYSKLDMTAVYC